MNQKQFLFEKNDCKVYKLTVLNHSYFIVEHAGKRYIRKSSAGVNGLISFLKEKRKNGVRVWRYSQTRTAYLENLFLKRRDYGRRQKELLRYLGRG